MFCAGFRRSDYGGAENIIPENIIPETWTDIVYDYPDKSLPKLVKVGEFDRLDLKLIYCINISYSYEAGKYYTEYYLVNNPDKCILGYYYDSLKEANDFIDDLLGLPRTLVSRKEASTEDKVEDEVEGEV